MNRRVLIAVRSLSFGLAHTLVTCTAPAQTVDWAAVHSLTMRGVNHLYDLEPEEAAAVFDSVARVAPGDPRGPFFRSMVEFWLYLLKRGEPEYEEFLARSERVVEICEGLLSANGNDAKAHFYLGGIYGYRGLAHQTHGSLLNAVSDGRQGFIHLEDAVRLDSTLYDAHMGFGIFRYMLAKAPRSLSWVLRLVGFEGDLEGGLRSVRLAADRGLYTRSEAGFYLAQFLFQEHRTDEALRYQRQIMREHPRNTLFLVTYAQWQFRLGNSDEALAASSKAVELNQRNRLRYGEEFAHNILASVSYSRNDFATARDNYAIYLRKVAPGIRIFNFTYYQAGVAHELTGDRATALRFYARVARNDDGDHRGDPFYFRLGQERARRPLSTGEAELIRGLNHLGRKDYDAAARSLHAAIAEDSADIDTGMWALYGIQQIHLDRGELSRGIEVSRTMLAMEPRRELWLVPHAWFRMGQLYAKLGDRREARRAFDRVRSYDGYDFQESLERRAAAEIGALEGDGREN